ncbi:MAG: polysaccharide biosynthesis tyrosine autokinase [Pleurocapsa sp. SU_5_0]|nr:polysaccharide biosynthesis tyrosine autokinase [Pleurocapsa sp. SU_5_0]NJR45514.1 polysaccharide biosynthesis tyrosine autokinase [Hyellaceae cyanobacterium CSU_1_1]
MDQNNWETETQGELGYGELFSKLWHRRLWFIGAFTGVLAIAVPLALIKPPIYQSDLQILAESNYQSKEITNGYDNQYLEKQFADASIEMDYATQLRVLTSSEILARVLNKLGINSPQESMALNKLGLRNLEEDSMTEILESFRESLSIYQVMDEGTESNEETETKVIQVSYFGTSPTGTRKVLKAIQEVYLEYNLEQQEKRLRDAITFIDKQIPQARKELREAETALTRLTKENNLVSPEAEATSIKENIRRIAQERKALQAQESEIIGNTATLEAQLGVSAENALALSRLSQSPRYQNLLNDLQKIEQDIARKQTNFTSNNPALQNAIKERKSVKDLLYKEAEQVLGKLPPNFSNDLESLQKQGQLVESDTEIAKTISQSQARLTGIQQRNLSLAETEAELEQRLIGFPELISQHRSLVQESEIKRQALQRLLEAKQELEIELSRGGYNWQVIEPPQDGLQIAPNLAKDLLLSLVVASFLGGFAAFVKDLTDETINTAKEIERRTSLPILGTAPGLSISSSNNLLTRLPFRSISSDISSLQNVIQWQPFREAIDLIYEHLKLAYFNAPLVGSALKSIAITSAVAGEGKSTLALGLALSIARDQQKVLVIDADLRSPSLHKSFALTNSSGLTNFLAGEISLPLIHQVSLSGASIDLITSGTMAEDPVKMLNSSRFERFIAQQKENYDLILVDTPPAIGMVDAIKIASICDSSLIVSRLNKSKVSEFLEATVLFSKLNVLGIVANDSQDVAKVYGKRPKYLLPQQV